MPETPKYPFSCSILVTEAQIYSRLKGAQIKHCNSWLTLVAIYSAK
jgi:hypothetical protein